MTKTQTGTIVVADITGYTRFLTESELAHAHDIIRELLNTIRESVQPGVRIIRTEGDAIFGYVPDGNDAPYLMDLVEGAYGAFRDHLLNVRVASTCTCNACKNTAELDLKLFAHRAEFIVEDLGGGRDDLSGPGVILTHRLLKNRWVQEGGAPAYFMATKDVYDAIERPEGATHHAESYEHFGEVDTFVFDLHAANERRRQQRAVVVAPEGAELSMEAVIDAPRALVWEYFADMNRYNAWTDPKNTFSWKGGARADGAEMHCAHGGGVSVSKVVAWQPYDHMTVVTSGAGFLQPAIVMSTHFRALSGGRTRVAIACNCREPGLKNALLVRLMGPMMRRYFEEGFASLQRMIVEDPANTTVAPKAEAS